MYFIFASHDALVNKEVAAVEEWEATECLAWVIFLNAFDGDFIFTVFTITVGLLIREP